MANKYSEITPQVRDLAEKCRQSSTIDSTLFTKYQVNRGLRDLKGNGVLTGLTEISEIQSSIATDDGPKPCDGKLFYRGINVETLSAASSVKNASDLRRPPICSYSVNCQPRSSSRNFSRYSPITAPCPPVLCGISS